MWLSIAGETKLPSLSKDGVSSSAAGPGNRVPSGAKRPGGSQSASSRLPSFRTRTGPGSKRGASSSTRAIVSMMLPSGSIRRATVSPWRTIQIAPTAFAIAASGPMAAMVPR